MLKPSPTLIACTAVIAVTMVGCTYWLRTKLVSAMPESVDYSDRLWRIHGDVIEIEKHAEATDEHLAAIEKHLSDIELQIQTQALLRGR